MVRIIYMWTIMSVLIVWAGPSFSNEKYSPRNCEFTVIFPETPTIKNVNVQEYFHQSATLVENNSVLRASCSIFNDNTLANITNDQIANWAKQWAERMGMIYPEVSIDNSTTGPVATVKGTKKIQGDFYTYKAVIYHGNYSRMAVIVGAPANEYPTKNIIPFLKSVYNNR